MTNIYNFYLINLEYIPALAELDIIKLILLFLINLFNSNKYEKENLLFILDLYVLRKPTIFVSC